MRRFLLIFFLVASTLCAANWYVDNAATGSHNGLSWANAWTSFSQITQASLSADDVVWIKGGGAAYNAAYTLTKSGTSGHRISYVGTGSARPKVYSFDGSGITDIAVINIEFYSQSTAQTAPMITWNASHRWLVQDCYFHDSFMDGISGPDNMAKSTGCVLRHNAFYYMGSINGGSAGGNSGTVSMEIVGDNILIEYNSFIRCMDQIRPFGTRIIIRNNLFGQTQTLYFPNSQPYPYHGDCVQSYEHTGAPLVQGLIDCNFDIDNSWSTGGGDGHFWIVQDTTYAAGTDNWHVIRRNASIREGESFILEDGVNGVRVYNNTIIRPNVGNEPGPYYGNAIGFQATIGSSSDWLVLNNTLSYSKNTMVDNVGGLYAGVSEGQPGGFLGDYNHTYSNVGPNPGIVAVTGGHDLAHVDPQFTDGTGESGHDNYMPVSGSPLRNAARAQTTAVGTGSNSTALTVADAKVLFDGWSIADADYIKIGSGAYVQISSINYGTNVVTLASGRSWSNGAAVVVQGTADVGALPYNAGGYTVSGTFSGTMATVNDSSLVRGVQPKIAGVPQAFVYTTPGSNTYTLPANTDAVDIYALYASATPVVAAATGASVTPARTRRGATSSLLQ